MEELNQTDLLWLENKNGEGLISLLVINTRTKENDKIYYVCGNVNNLLTTTDSIYELLKDRNLIKIFYNSSDLFTYVFSITSPRTQQYIFTRMTKEDYNITHPELVLALQNSVNING